jgi:hypothetical protein
MRGKRLRARPRRISGPAATRRAGVAMGRRLRFAASLHPGGFTPRLERELQLPGHLVAICVRESWSIRSPLVRPFTPPRSSELAGVALLLGLHVRYYGLCDFSLRLRVALSGAACPPFGSLLAAADQLGRGARDRSHQRVHAGQHSRRQDPHEPAKLTGPRVTLERRLAIVTELSRFSHTREDRLSH